MQEILYDNTPQEVFIKLFKPDVFSIIDGGGPSDTVCSIEYTGSIDGEVMAGATVTLKEYKKDNVTLTSPSITWNDAIHSWKISIPALNVTQCGNCLLTVKKTDVISPTTIEFKTVSSSDFLNSFRSQIIDGEFTWIQVQRIIAAAMAGVRTRSSGIDTFKGLDGKTPRYVVASSPDARNILILEGD